MFKETMMRAFLLGALLATAAGPAFAQATQQLPATTTVLRSETAVERSALALPSGPVDGRTFVAQAEQNAWFSSEISQTALARSQNPKVQELARAVVASRAVTMQQLAILAGAQATPFPGEPPPALRQTARELAAAPAAEFDLRYVNLQTEAVQQVLALYGTGIRIEGEPLLRAAALRELPTLQTQQSAALELGRALTPPIEISAERDIRLDDISPGAADLPLTPRQRMQPRTGGFAPLDDLGPPGGGLRY